MKNGENKFMRNSGKWTIIDNVFGFTAEFPFRKLNEGTNQQRIKYDVPAPEHIGCQAMRCTVLKLCIPILHRTNLPLDKRGKHDTLHKILVHKILVHKKSKIQLHIESFNPAVTHYRRSHAPLRRYLPPELTIRLMFSDFKGKNPEVQCSERRFSR